jgi:O-antigen/teichoic acid export membrane protein
MTQTAEQNPPCSLSRERDGHLAKNTLWIFMGQIGWQCLRAGYFLIIARSLGPAHYGAFIGVVALVAMLAPFSSLGTAGLLIKNVSRNRAVFNAYWGNALVTLFGSGSLLTLLALALCRIVLPADTPIRLIVCVMVADLIFARLLDVSASAFQAFDRLNMTATLYTLGGLCRLLAAVILVLVFKEPSASSWAVLYLISAAISAGIAVTAVKRQLGSPTLALRLIRSEAKEGLYFSCAQAAENIYNDLDKTMLTALSTLQAAGIYAVAYRVIEAVFVPVNSLLWASYARFFVKGAGGIHGSTRYAKRLLSHAGGYSVVVSLGLVAVAPLLPRILGPQYQSSAEALRWLAPILVLRTVHRFYANSLTGAGFQGTRTVTQAGVAVFNVLLNLWLIPAYSWRGAAWSSLASDSLLLVSAVLIVSRLTVVGRQTDGIQQDVRSPVPEVSIP